MAGDLAYFWIPTPDDERAKTFYGELFGWTFEPGSVPGGHQISGVSPPGGLFGGGPGSSPHVYFEVDDIRASVGQIRELGGEAEEPQEIASGWMAGCRDDQGTEFNIWQTR